MILKQKVNVHPMEDYNDTMIKLFIHIIQRSKEIYTTRSVVTKHWVGTQKSLTRHFIWVVKKF